MRGALKEISVRTLYYILTPWVRQSQNPFFPVSSLLKQMSFSAKQIAAVRRSSAAEPPRVPGEPIPRHGCLPRHGADIRVRGHLYLFIPVRPANGLDNAWKNLRSQPWVSREGGDVL
jgi:hypothetical protein